jgi:AmmeMemoRadiSam system protein A/AmmeMemoRadiSam system protein B
MHLLAAFVLPHPPVALPEIGRGEELKISRTIDGYKKVAALIAQLKPDTIVLCSPHAPLSQDAFFISERLLETGSFARFSAPSTRVNATTDLAFVHELIRRSPDFIASAHESSGLDHGTMVPLHFINKSYTDYKLVRIGLSMADAHRHFKIGEAIRDTAEALDKRIVFIASGDLSHRLMESGPYGFVKEGPIFDEEIVEILKTGQLEKLNAMAPEVIEDAGECGYRSLLILAGVVHGLRFKSELYSYEGPFGVGYATAGFLPSEHKDSDPYVKLARLAIEDFVLKKVETEIPHDTPSELTDHKAGVFVSLHMNGNLRGCIGTIFPTTSSIAHEILRNAVLACSEDPRFFPVKHAEVDFLDIGVDVLGAPEDIDDKTLLDVKRYGVIVTKGRRRGLLLPDLEGVDTVDQQIKIALSKAGIAPDEEYTLQRFEVVRHHD